MREADRIGQRRMVIALVVAMMLKDRIRGRAAVTQQGGEIGDDAIDLRGGETHRRFLQKVAQIDPHHMPPGQVPAIPGPYVCLRT